MTDSGDTIWWRRVLGAADRALDLPPDERASYLDRQAAADPSLIREVRALLDRAEAPSPLDGPALPFVAPLIGALATDDCEGPFPMGLEITRPAQLGPYRIVRELGRGGMGAVYLAERADAQFDQRVALKVLPPWTSRDSRRVLRFVEERQILAALDHPGIARLVDGGVAVDGLPWFAMEYVDGLPLDQYCDERRLPVEARLELFCAVCAAVQYAHRNLVVHRDLKPANILVAEGGRVRLLDFGIAKLLGDAGSATLTNDRMLTPLYASPEQVRGGPISTATDVYALGVLLHLLLTGRHPYRLTATDPLEVARAVLEQEPTRPSVAILRSVPSRAEPLGDAEAERRAAARASTPAAMSRRLRGDLDAIVLRAMEKDPAQRYGSAQQLEADVRRHLDGLPIAASAGGRTYRARKFVRRHRLGVLASAIVAGIVIAFTSVALVQASRIRVQNERLARERDRMERLLAYGRAEYRGAPNTVDRAELVREVLDSGAARISKPWFSDLEDQAATALELARGYVRVNDLDRARVLAESSVVFRRRRSPSVPAGLAESQQFAGDVFLAQGRLADAARAYTEALALRRAINGAPRTDVARALVGLANVRRGQRRFASAESFAREAIALDRAAGADVELAQSTGALARVLMDKGDHRGAVAHADTALALIRRRRPEEDIDVAGAVFALAMAATSAGEHARGDSLRGYALGLHHRLLAGLVLSAPPGAWAATAASVTRILEGPAGDGVSRAPLDAAPNGRTPPPAPPTADPEGDSRIVFLSDRDAPDPLGTLGQPEIYTMRPDGSDQRRLTFNDDLEQFVAPSPDGTRIAFSRWRNSASDIYVMNADGSGERRLTNLGEMGGIAPAWSPDGRRLAFHTVIGGDVHVMNADGSMITALTSHRALDAQPAWSPDGRRIAFQSNRHGRFEIFTMGADGGELVRLTDNGADDTTPEWSPDGRQIVFTSTRHGNKDIYVMRADGSDQRRLTSDRNQEDFASWSPDGTRIVFHRRVLGHARVHVMNADGSGQRPLTALSPVIYNGFPSWGRVTRPPAADMRARR